MEKSDKKRILTRVLVVLAALTLLSCCFLGSTFARYVTRANGSGKVGVALWNITISGDGTGTTAVSFSDLSPDANTGGKGATHSTGWVKIATITNGGDVDAQVTVSVSSLTVGSGNWATDSDKKPGWSQYVSDDELNKVFKLTLASDDEGTALSDPMNLAKTDGPMNIYAQVTWTTQSDAQDTFFGENLLSLTWSISYSAVQAEELPPARP